ncbi:MAG TPA: glycosyltransferase family 4 protein [Actinomycetota bacterium]|nr:glycosyltransferase family 4 protein [Actinomycetota bacterium]
MRIAFYSRRFPPDIGGMERFADDLTKWLAAQSHEVVVITTSTGQQEAGPIRVLRNVSMRQQIRAMRLAHAVHINGLSVRGILLSLMAGKRPVVTHQGHQGICPTGLSWSRTGPCTASGEKPGPCPNCPGRSLVGRIKVLIHRLAMRAARKNVFVSSYLEARVGGRNSTVIFNPVARSAFEAPETGGAEDRRIVFAGRLVEEKGATLLIDATALLSGASLDIIGDGPVRAELEKRSYERGLDGRVRFHGRMSLQQIKWLLSRGSVACVPTLCPEAFGYSAAESMAMGRAVAATPNGALAELLSEGRGFLAEASTAEALADALRQALESQQARDEAAAKSRTFATDHFRVEMLGPHYVECYKS